MAKDTKGSVLVERVPSVEEISGVLGTAVLKSLGSTNANLLKLDAAVRDTSRLKLDDATNALADYWYPVTTGGGSGGGPQTVLGVIHGTHMAEPAAQAPLRREQPGYSKPMSQSVGRESDYVGKAVAHIKGVIRRAEAPSAQELRADATGLRLGYHDIRDVTDRMI